MASSSPIGAAGGAGGAFLHRQQPTHHQSESGAHTDRSTHDLDNVLHVTHSKLPKTTNQQCHIRNILVKTPPKHSPSATAAPGPGAGAGPGTVTRSERKHLEAKMTAAPIVIMSADILLGEYDGIPADKNLRQWTVPSIPSTACSQRAGSAASNTGIVRSRLDSAPGSAPGSSQCHDETDTWRTHSDSGKDTHPSNEMRTHVSHSSRDRYRRELKTQSPIRKRKRRRGRIIRGRHGITTMNSTPPAIPSRFETILHHEDRKPGFTSSASRFEQPTISCAPGPGAYSVAKAAEKPSYSKKGLGGFASASRRFESIFGPSTMPGPGTYHNPAATLRRATPSSTKGTFGPASSKQQSVRAAAVAALRDHQRRIAQQSKQHRVSYSKLPSYQAEKMRKKKAGFASSANRFHTASTSSLHQRQLSRSSDSSQKNHASANLYASHTSSATNLQQQPQFPRRDGSWDVTTADAYRNAINQQSRELLISIDDARSAEKLGTASAAMQAADIANILSQKLDHAELTMARQKRQLQRKLRQELAERVEPPQYQSSAVMKRLSAEREQNQKYSSRLSYPNSDSPGPGTYDVSVPWVVKQFVSNGKQKQESVIRGSRARAMATASQLDTSPGPAYYAPTDPSSKLETFHVGTSHWV
jgi:Sperm-tail PG-rich repeat